MSLTHIFRVVVAATIGGTVSKLTGGKFSNGERAAKRKTLLEKIKRNFKTLGSAFQGKAGFGPGMQAKFKLFSLLTVEAGGKFNILQLNADLSPPVSD